MSLAAKSSLRLRCAGWLVLALFGTCLLPSPGWAVDEILSEGFTEPYRTVEVAAPEMGIVHQLFVEEGQLVEVNQLLATLDQDVYKAQLAIAESSAKTRGALESAEAELLLRRERASKLEELLSKGFADPKEVTRALTDARIAASNLLSVQEDLEIKRLEVERLKLQLERRNLRAPLSGVVTKLHKQVGEFVAPNDPKLLSLVQLNPLAASFSVSSLDARELRSGQPVTVMFEREPRSAPAVVDFVAPVTDAESGTVRVKVRMENAQGRYRSGEHCTLQLAPPATRPRDALSRTQFDR